MMNPTDGQIAIRLFQPGDEDAIAAILWEAFEAGEFQGSTRSDVDHWRIGIPGDPSRTLVATLNEQVVGLLTLPVDHVVVASGFRRRGIGTKLVEAAEQLATERGEAPLYLALPRNNPGALAFYAALGWQYHHSLWSMRIDNEIAVPTAEFPASVVRCPYRADLIPQFVEMINSIFLDHPSPLSVTLDQITFAHTNPSFNPDSLCLLADADDLEQLVGFCRVGFEREDDAVSGWIPLLGVLRAWRRHGLGRQLLHWGVNFAREQEPVSAVYLAVEGENERALHIYEATGFRRDEEWPRYGRAASS